MYVFAVLTKSTRERMVARDTSQTQQCILSARCVVRTVLTFIACKNYVLGQRKILR